MDFMLGHDVDPIFSTLQHVMDVAEETDRPSPTRAYMRDRKAMARTSADVKELPDAYVFEVDMPGVPGSDIKVQVEEGNLLRVSGQRKREDQETKEEKGDGVRYLKMERRMGKFMRQFPLPENANTDSVKASCKDGVVTVTVEKVPPPEPKKPKVVEVHVALEFGGGRVDACGTVLG